MPLKNGANDVNGRDTHEYEPGHATEMLSQSVNNLKIVDAAADDFKVQAGKIITTMLENRINEKNALNGKAIHNNNNISSNGNGNKSIVANGNSIKSKAAALLCDSMATPTIPLSKPFTKLTSIAATADTNNDKMLLPSSPTHSLTDLPLPPPPAELIIAHADAHDHTRIDDDNDADNDDNIDAIDRKTISDLNDNDILLIDDKQCLDDTVSVGQKQYQRQQQPQQPPHHHHQQLNGRDSGVVFRNKNFKPELTTHARDRRSYIGQDHCAPNRFSHNNHLITSHTTEIASNLRDGKHPICSVCHVKITRYAISTQFLLFRQNRHLQLHNSVVLFV